MTASIKRNFELKIRFLWCRSHGGGGLWFTDNLGWWRCHDCGVVTTLPMGTFLR